jgi:tetratricopeptide (TPR) repeat protein
MKKIKIIQLSMLLSLCSVTLSAQEKQMAAAGKLFNEHAYIDAISEYEQIVKRGYKSVELFEKLGDAYYYNGELEKSAQWYGELFALGQEVDPEYYYRYAQSLKKTGQYNKSNIQIDEF